MALHAVKQPSVLFAAILAFSASTLFAQWTLDDLEHGTNQNYAKAYWYYYDDCEDGGDSKIKDVAAYDPTVCGDGKYEFLPTSQVGYNGTMAAKLEYEMGPTEPSCGAGCTYGNMVGIGTMLAPEGSSIDISGATAITFQAKASATMTVRVEVATAAVTDFAYHRAEFEVSSNWAQYTVNLLDQGIEFKQPDWTQTPVDFDPTTVEKIQWQVSMDYPSNPTAGNLLIDEVQIAGWEPDFSCQDCKIAAGSWGTTVDGLTLSSFDKAPLNKNAIGYYWYCYNDAEGRTVTDPTEYSNIFGGVTPNSTEPTKPIIKIDGNGHSSTNGAFIDFELGPTYEEIGTTIQPFVGIGTMLSDNLGTEFYDAEAANATGVYFDYKTSSDVDYLRLEVKANKDYGNPGIVHSVLLQGTDGQWKGAKVLWSTLKLPDWDEVNLIADKSLKTTELEKIQWAFQGKPQTSASFAIDNVGLIGASGGAPVHNFKSHGKVSAFSATHKDNSLILALPASLDNAQLTVTDLGGRMLYSRKVRTQSAAAYTIPFSLNTLSNGTYFVRLTDKHISHTMQLSIVK
ncbi:MAG: hypothetical protein GF398_00525 [Chitinivibrionales bacterium]|nr:hypothetical protein [Chitinivibrionales bacterium]